MARSVAILRNLLSSTRRMVSMGLGLVSLLIGLGQGCHEGDSVRLGRAYLRKGIPARAGDARASIDSSFLPRFLHLRNILEYAVFRGFVWAEAEEYRGAEFGGGVAGLGPLSKFDFGDEVRADPLHFLERLDFSGEGGLFCFAGVELLPNGVERGFVESAAGLAYVDELAFLVVEAEYDGAEVLAAVLG